MPTTGCPTSPALGHSVLLVPRQRGDDVGVVAAVLNRSGSLGPALNRRSRGELVLEALDHAEAEAAAHTLCDLSPTSYRSFNLVVADTQDAFWLRHAGEDAGAIEMAEIPLGLSMITDFERNDTACPRIRDYLPLFAVAPVPVPENDDWAAWETLLAGRSLDPENDSNAAMTLRSEGGITTLSSSIIALPAPCIPTPKPPPTPKRPAMKPENAPRSNKRMSVSFMIFCPNFQLVFVQKSLYQIAFHSLYALPKKRDSLDNLS